MSTVLYEDLQLRREPPIEPVTLTLTLAPSAFLPSSSSNSSSPSPTPHFDKTIGNIPNENHQFPSNPETDKPNSRSFWEAFSNNPKKVAMEKPQEKQSYLHPTVRRNSSLKLSEKSLQLCTENLGCETGSDLTSGFIITNGSNFIGSLSSAGKSPAREEGTKTNYVKKKTSRSLSFPPPLTTIAENAFKVESHREGGRLVVEATRSPSRSSCFKAERSQGRLKLSILKMKPDIETEQKQGCEENEEEKIENDIKECEFDEADCYDNEEDEESDEGNVMSGAEEEIEMGMEMEMFQRTKLIRCKDGDQHENKRLLNWEPYLVATTS